MAAFLLSTKFYVPPARADAILRLRLTEKLRSGVNRPGSCLTLISGPAGAGKTTLLSGFVAGLHQKAAWLSLDEADNDPGRFWSCVITACQSILDGVGESAMALLRTPQPLPEDTIPTLLINDLMMHENPVILVLDDFHVIQNPYIHDSFLFLLDHLPSNLHLVVSTRTDPPWPLARYRARNQLVEIRAQDLRFNPNEAAEFLNRVMGLHLSTEDIAALEERTEGWAAGLQLAALSMLACSDVKAFFQAFTGSHSYVAEYLLEEILNRQAKDMQNFLLKTAILERMNGELCNTVTQCQDGQARLMALQRANLFIIPLDNEGGWFRYHHLFADLLLARLSQTASACEVTDLHIRAADWYERNGFPNEAIHHALAARDFNRVASLVERAAQPMMDTGQFNLLKTWLKALPKESLRTHPRLEILFILIDLSQAKLDMSEQTLIEKENMIRALPPSPENDRLRVEALVSLCLFLAHHNSSRAIRTAEEILAELPEGNLRMRANLFSVLYRGYGMEGDIEKSEPAYQECLRLALAAGQYTIAANTTMVRAFDLGQYARLQEAAQYCQVIIEAGTQLGEKIFYPAGPAYIGLAGVYLEQNELEMAEASLERGLALCRQAGLDGIYVGHIQKARLHQAKGNFVEALDELSMLEKTLHRRDFTLTARQVSIRLAMQDTEGASRWVQPLIAMLDGSPGVPRLPLIAAEAFRLVIARILLAQDAVEQAILALDEIQSTAEPGQRFGRLIEIYLLRALAVQKQQAGQILPPAVQYLERALELAEPEGIRLLFFEEGPALVPLLAAAANDLAVPARIQEYAIKLLRAFPKDEEHIVPRPAVTATEWIEPLTSREMDVLRCIAAGDSNQDIANRLVITVRTVKKHAGNIYDKLNVSSRTQAVSRARALGLLPRE